jgi:hypothetical protein
MKIMLMVFCVLCAATAVGQTGAISSEAYALQLPEHPQHAAPHAMAAEQPIVGGGNDTYQFAHGERPLWEFGPVSEEPSLGDVARAYRKQKLTGKKAEIVFEKQGS